MIGLKQDHSDLILFGLVPFGIFIIKEALNIIGLILGVLQLKHINSTLLPKRSLIPPTQIMNRIVLKRVPLLKHRTIPPIISDPPKLLIKIHYRKGLLNIHVKFVGVPFVEA